MTTISAPILLDFEAGIAHIRLNRPDVLNAVDSAMARALRDVCLRLERDPELRVVLISGEGRAFMAGGDIAQFRDAPGTIGSTLIEPLHEALESLARMRAPVVASVHGAVVGAGLSLALACDLTVAAKGTRFSSAYAGLGASCDLGASWHLPRVVGLRRALELALLNDTIDAEQALQMGLVNRVVPAESIAEVSLAIAARLAAGPTVALGHLKRLLRESSACDLPTQLAAERTAFESCAATEDFTEGVRAFLARRAPHFAGR